MCFGCTCRRLSIKPSLCVGVLVRDFRLNPLCVLGVLVGEFRVGHRVDRRVEAHPTGGSVPHVVRSR